jgi:hypothetical protein
MNLLSKVATLAAMVGMPPPHTYDDISTGDFWVLLLRFMFEWTPSPPPPPSHPQHHHHRSPLALSLHRLQHKVLGNHVDLSHISPERLAVGDRLDIRNLVDILFHLTTAVYGRRLPMVRRRAPEPTVSSLVEPANTHRNDPRLERMVHSEIEQLVEMMERALPESGAISPATKRQLSQRHLRSWRRFRDDYHNERERIDNEIRERHRLIEVEHDERQRLRLQVYAEERQRDLARQYATRVVNEHRQALTEIRQLHHERQLSQAERERIAAEAHRNYLRDQVALAKERLHRLERQRAAEQREMEEEQRRLKRLARIKP